MTRKSLVTLVLVLVSCSGETVSSTTFEGTTVTSSAVDTTATTSAQDTSTTPPAEQSVQVPVPIYGEMGPGWSELFFPYGDGEESLGTSPGGEGLMWGPDYGTQTPDGTWWFLDAARLRIAHFDGDGVYLGQIRVPEDLLVDGVYFQFQMPQALDDGSIAVGGFDRPLLRVVDGEISGHQVTGAIPWDTTDGVYLYGLGFDDGTPRRAHPDNPVIETVDWYGARDGSRYRVTMVEDELLVELPDAGLTRSLQPRFADDPEVVVRAGIEVESGADGTLFILLNGAPSSDETLGVGGIVSISGDGTVGETEPVVDPFSMSDPGSPAHLGVTPGTASPWYMVVGEDGVRVFSRAG